MPDLLPRGQGTGLRRMVLRTIAASNAIVLFLSLVMLLLAALPLLPLLLPLLFRGLGFSVATRGRQKTWWLADAGQVHVLYGFQ